MIRNGEYARRLPESPLAVINKRLTHSRSPPFLSLPRKELDSLLYFFAITTMEPPPPPAPPILGASYTSSTGVAAGGPTVTTIPSRLSSYPDSVDSSPRSRNTDSFDDPSLATIPGGYAKLRLMCSYGGHIVPRSHDKSLCYVGGETRIVVVDRNSSLPELLSRLSKILLDGRSFTLKYLLPNEDLDSLITVSTEEDLENMLDEYDRLIANSSPSKPSRIRLFLFPTKPETASSLIGPILDGSNKSEDWFLSVLNGTDDGVLQRGFSDPTSVDCLLGLEKNVNNDGANNNSAANSKDVEAQLVDMNSGKLGNQNNSSSNQDVHSVPGSPIIETTSSFGSSSSSPSLANLPPIRVHVEDGGGGGGGGNGGGGGVRVLDQQRIGIEEQYAQMGLGLQKQQQDEGGFVALSSPPTVKPSMAAAAAAAVVTGMPAMLSGQYLNRVVSDDERSDQGVPVGYRKPSPPQTLQAVVTMPSQPQLKQIGSDLSSPDSVSSDSSLSSAITRQQQIVYQDQVGQIPSGGNRVSPNLVDFKVNVSDPNAQVQMLQNSDGLYAVAPQYDLQQQQQQYDLQQQQQQYDLQQQQQQQYDLQQKQQQQYDLQQKQQQQYDLQQKQQQQYDLQQKQQQQYDLQQKQQQQQQYDLQQQQQQYDLQQQQQQQQLQHQQLLQQQQLQQQLLQQQQPQQQQLLQQQQPQQQQLRQQQQPQQQQQQQLLQQPQPQQQQQLRQQQQPQQQQQQLLLQQPQPQQQQRRQQQQPQQQQQQQPPPQQQQQPPPPPQQQQQQQTQLQPQAQQLIHAGPHFVPHHPSGAMPISTYYPLYPSQQPQLHHQLDQQYPVYYVPAGQAQAYSFPVQQPNFNEAANSIHSSRPQTPPSATITSAAYNVTRNMPPKPEMSAGVYRTAATASQPLVQVPSGQHQPQQQQFIGYSQIPHHPSQSVAPTSAATGSYAYEFADPAHTQLYFTQPLQPTLASQYQTMTSAPGVVLPNASAQLPTETVKQQEKGACTLD
ncbi:hypothetical protein Ancab_021100 [Ancistrocladus abbreviatus]